MAPRTDIMRAMLSPVSLILFFVIVSPAFGVCKCWVVLGVRGEGGGLCRCAAVDPPTFRLPPSLSPRSRIVALFIAAVVNTF